MEQTERGRRIMDFGIMFFSSLQPHQSAAAYRLLLEASRYADDHGFCCVWTPERHFHPFGGLFPNPSVVGAAVAMVTRRMQIRAGSLISPLHDVLRIAEEWSVVDNLSEGRVAVSFGSGWNIDDFVLYPERYGERQAIMYRQIEEIRDLWRGGRLSRMTSAGRSIEVEIFPRPVQRELPVWVTSSGHPETFVKAGRIGANVLTHLIGQDLGQLAGRIELYRQAYAEGGRDPLDAKVSLMLHTYLDRDMEAVRKKVREPFREYLRSAISLERLAAEGGGVISGGHKVAPHEIPPTAMEDLLDSAFHRYFRTASLMGVPESCNALVWQLHEIGVDEIACLIDFIDDVDAVIGSLALVAELCAAFGPQAGAAVRTSVADFLEDLEA